MRYYSGVQVLGVAALYHALVGDERHANTCAMLAIKCQEAAEEADIEDRGFPGGDDVCGRIAHMPSAATSVVRHHDYPKV